MIGKQARITLDRGLTDFSTDWDAHRTKDCTKEQPGAIDISVYAYFPEGRWCRKRRLKAQIPLDFGWKKKEIFNILIRIRSGIYYQVHLQINDDDENNNKLQQTSNIKSIFLKWLKHTFTPIATRIFF